MLYLLDANVLIAMAWPNHPFHAHARTWFLQYAATGWATCGLTETAFICLSANPIVVGQARRPAEAW
jgi:predicted nucleic acid-binding protein